MLAELRAIKLISIIGAADGHLSVAGVEVCSVAGLGQRTMGCRRRALSVDSCGSEGAFSNICLRVQIVVCIDCIWHSFGQ